jgi:CheY-specific phosphatase CheX
MPETPVQCALRESVGEVLEKMFFVEPLDEPPVAADPPDGEIAVKLSFEGSPSGVLTLSVSPDAARQVAADFLGEEPSDLAAGRIGEVVCELANMICGSVLSRVESSSTFRLAAPSLLMAEEWRRRPETADCRAVHSVAIGDGILTATLETRDPVCTSAEKSVF